MVFTQRIFELLEAQGKSKAELARYLGIRPTTVTEWHTKGKKPSSDYISRISEFLGVTCDYLLTGENSSATLTMPAIQHTNAVEAEMLRLFRLLPESEQLKLLGRTEVLVELAEQAKAEDNAV